MVILYTLVDIIFGLFIYV